MVFTRSVTAALAAVTMWVGAAGATPPTTVPPVTTPPPVTTVADDPPPPPTVNEFLPTDRNVSDCVGTLQRPGCGSEARGGWRQTLVFAVMMGGLGIILWRIVVGARRARRESLLSPGPDATSVRDASGGDRAP